MLWKKLGEEVVGQTQHYRWSLALIQLLWLSHEINEMPLVDFKGKGEGLLDISSSLFASVEITSTHNNE